MLLCQIGDKGEKCEITYVKLHINVVNVVNIVACNDTKPYPSEVILLLLIMTLIRKIV